MIAARRDTDGVVSTRRAENILQKVLSGAEEQIARRSDYAGTLKRLTAAVPGTNVLVEVFEEMVTGAGFARLCAFLGIEGTTPDLRPVHIGQNIEMTHQQRDAARAWLAPQYAAAEHALGRMPAAWKG